MSGPIGAVFILVVVFCLVVVSSVMTGMAIQNATPADICASAGMLLASTGLLFLLLSKIFNFNYKDE